MHPYIGITDFTNFGQVEEMLKIFKAGLPPGSKRKLHVGVMTSYKMLNGIPNKWQNAFPPLKKISEIFSSDEVYNCLHYADYDDYPELEKSLKRVIEFGGEKIHALQLDMVWPDPREIEIGVAASQKKIEIILQIGKNALEKADNDPKTVIQELEAYKNIVHRVLLDKSMGKGLGMDADSLIPFAQAIKESYPHLGISAAGGLGPETMHLVEPLVKLFPDLSIDAQGRLRPSGNALDPIDWTMATKYLIRALKLFS